MSRELHRALSVSRVRHVRAEAVAKELLGGDAAGARSERAAVVERAQA
jgi:hypothetical protein